MIIIKADTAEECKDEIVNWLRTEANANSSQARLARKRTLVKELQQREIALLAAANYIERSIKVMPK